MSTFDDNVFSILLEFKIITGRGFHTENSW